MSDEAIARGQRAEREFKEVEAAFDAVRAACVARVFETPTSASDQREQLYMAVQSLDAVRKAMRMVIDNGQIEQAAKEAAEALATSKQA